VDEEGIGHLTLIQLETEIPCLLGDEGAVRVPRCAGYVNAAGADLDEEQHVEGLEEGGFHGEEVTCQDALGLGTQELGPARTGSAGCGSESLFEKDSPNGGCPHMDAEFAELALDPDVAPTGVLCCHADRERADLGIEPRAAGSLLAVGPLSFDELAVPTKERLRCDDEARPPVLRQDPRRCREEDPVPAPQFGPAGFALQDLHLVPKDEDLDLAVVRVARRSQAEDGAKRHIEE